MRRVFFSFYFLAISSLLIIQFIVAPLVGKVIYHYQGDLEDKYSENLAKGVYHLLELDLLQLPEDKWGERIAELSAEFGYDIFLSSIDKLKLDPHHIQQLEQGKIVIVENGEYLYYRVAESPMVIGKGPFSKLEPQLGFMPLYFWLAFLISLALFTIILIIPFWKKLRRITAAAIGFGNGEFNNRAQIGRHSSLFPVAEAFNTMADRIQQLINSHKQLTNAVSHELRTPISRMRFGLEMMELTKDERKRQNYTNGLHKDVAELEELVSELLTFAHFDREKPELTFEAIPLEPFISKLIRDVIPQESTIECTLTNNLLAPSAQVVFDYKYLGRAITNLIQNSLKHAEHQVNIMMKQNGQDCILHIDDDGPGIAVADRERIFEPFTRLDASRTRATGGYGLGLAIVFHIMQWHGGSISVSESQQGGARVTLTWPGFQKVKSDGSMHPGILMVRQRKAMPLYTHSHSL